MTEFPLILAVAPIGACKTHAQHPAVPITPHTLAAIARSCLDAGAAMLHRPLARADQIRGQFHRN